MTEKTPHHERSTALRRSILKGAAVVTAATGMLVAKRELDITEQGLETKNAIFFPLYERHDIGIREEHLPAHLDYFFREVKLRKEEFEMPAREILALDPGYTPEEKNLSQLQNADRGKLFNKSVLESLAKGKVRVVIGDTAIPFEEYIKLLNRLEERREIQQDLGLALETSGLLMTMRNFLGSETAQRVTRRSVVAIGSVITGISLRYPFLAFRIQNPAERTAFARIGNRLKGLASHTVQEDHVVFFRNLVMANKLLTLAQSQKKKEGKLKIAFNVGAAHAGIEDFLTLGHDFTRWLINQYPTSFLEEFVNVNGSIENFTSLRIFTLPPDLKKEQLTDPDENIEILEERMYDESLLKTLKERLFKPS